MFQYVVSIANFAGLMALTALSCGVALKVVSAEYKRQLVFGTILGLGAAVVSLQPIMVVNGIQIDPRNLFVGCAGAFGGPLAGAISFAFAAATRFYEGGSSIYVCILSLLVATCAGLAWRSFVRHDEKIDQRHLLVLGIVISLSYVCTFLLPRADWAAIFFSAIPVLTVTNVIGTMVLGGFLEKERRQHVRELTLHNQASVDPLTGLRNRRAFEAAYVTLLLPEISVGMAYLLVDLDNFKNVNDTYGHAVGDSVLVRVAEKLRASVRDVDLTARFGGEEFAVCLPNTSRAQSIMVAERIRKAVSEIDDVDTECKLSVSASVGVCWSKNALEMDAAFDTADQALYRAKMNGRNQVVFDDQTLAAVQSAPLARPTSMRPNSANP